MQYIVDTCRPGQCFSELFNEAKKIISGAGAPESLHNRYNPPRVLEAPTLNVLATVK